ncbi:hypothetical protein OIO90_000483 [Microbotryomycetes sp. JL221]|nr:hypothetical protein OIO90_000483 [Microbotryomycetes sp. JL221]
MRLQFGTCFWLVLVLAVNNVPDVAARHSIRHQKQQQRNAVASSSLSSTSSTSTLIASKAVPNVMHRGKSVHKVQAETKHRWLKRSNLICGLLGVLCDYSSDVNNCGVKGNKCPTKWANGSGATCQAGVCGAATCATAYDFSWTLGKCVQTQNDEFNCGKAGFVCSVPFATIQKCVSGECKAGKCQKGFEEIDGACLKEVDLSSDIQNCGKRGVSCPETWANGVGSQCNNGACKPRTCNTGYAFDFLKAQCRDVYSDVNNCGGIGQWVQPAFSTTVKANAKKAAVDTRLATHLTPCNGKCYASVCAYGYQLISVNNCGAVGRVCTFTPSGASGVCSNSQCKVTTCPKGYGLSAAGYCVGATVSQRARVKKSKIVKQTLCPLGEIACPIADSESFEMAVTHHFSAPFNEYSGIMAGAGGYECLDIESSLESCGGCTSTGEGQDCTAIPNALGVGCDLGKCHVFSCAIGFKPSISGRNCVSVRAPSYRPSRNTTASTAEFDIDEYERVADEDELMAMSSLGQPKSTVPRSTRRQKRSIIEAAEAKIHVDAGSRGSIAGVSFGGDSKASKSSAAGSRKKRNKPTKSSSSSQKHARALHQHQTQQHHS